MSYIKAGGSVIATPSLFFLNPGAIAPTGQGVNLFTYGPAQPIQFKANQWRVM